MNPESVNPESVNPDLKNLSTSIGRDGDAPPALASFRRIVVKIGSSLLIDPVHGGLRPVHGGLRASWLSSCVDDLARLARAGADILIVSSGAIALGRSILDLPRDALKLEESQAAAAVGQIALSRAYAQAFDVHAIRAAQILLTLDDTEDRRRYLNARGTLDTLLRMKAVPIINENDTVATSEIRYGDNDRLAARVAAMTGADCLILLSDVDGLYTAPPGTPGAVLVERIDMITPDVEAMAGAAASHLSRGGMITKLEAARIALNAGVHMAIANGVIEHPIERLRAGGAASWFVPKATPLAARKAWIGGSLKPMGVVFLDSGAVHALERGRSLLPAGVVRLEGCFSRGDAVIVKGPDQCEVGRGLIAYDLCDARRIIGRKSDEIESILGYIGRRALIHRDDFVHR